MSSKIINLQENEEIEDLQFNGLQIIQNKDLYRFTSDAVLLANLVKAKKDETVVDLGTGSGIIAILVSAKNATGRVVGVELQPKLAQMAKKSVELNQLNIEILNTNMLNFLDSKFREQNDLKSVDVVVCNPPYKKGCSKININLSKSIARHEVEVTLKQVVQVASAMLKFKGRFYTVCDADRSAEIIYYLKEYKLEPKKILFTQSSETSEAKLVFIEAVKGGKEGVRIMPMLITNDSDGSYLHQIKNMKL